MRLSRLLLPIVGALIAVAAPSVAKAQPYPPTGPTVTVSDTTVVVNETVLLTGTGFGANETVTITVEYQAIGMGVPRGSRSFVVPTRQVAEVSARTNDDGEFKKKLTLTTVGRAIITATGDETGRSGSVSVLVLSSRHELPTTGTDGSSYLRVAIAGLAAVLVGGALVGFTVRRRRARGSLT